ncbi:MULTISPECIES: hypothetical protein [Sphingobium]|jgi:hypothetical protein|uniref:Cytochrome C oxidase assembly protein n=1 Tax=Sphingobium cupriresistens LL01 TaxID=1420583 RepID=A0A0J8AR62_9SPHN|nr:MULTISPECIES: hypothetical protein [Sphingobium]KMS56890.1 cytochrome C oxidase assembly protein [Sphingobium cupriresistens LL01]MEC3951211.1 hypothetical protein [Sphingobium sp. HWE2-09]WCP13846.1 hypothetical protein sphantq_02284 [Sphingobium sp. AntQ-1]
MTPEELEKVRARQKSRALVMGLLLGALVLLFYGITIAKMGGN